MEFAMAKKHKSAFTLVELLMSLMILGFLMAAVAVAFDASITNYQVNEGIYRAANTGRQALLRITNDIRTAQAVALALSTPGTSNYTQLTGLNNDSNISRLSLRTANGEDITYRFDLPTTTLFLDINTSGSSNVLCTNVSAMTFPRATVSGSSPVAIRNVRILMTVSDADSNVSQTLAAAAVVRRNL